MKKLFIILCLTTFTSALFATSFLDAIAKVESNHKANAIGDKGKAVGKFQLWKSYVDDVNRISGKTYTYNDRFSPEKSREMVLIYLNHYGKRYTKVTGKPVTLEILARIHNGGPNGYKKDSTVKYWNKVKNEM